MFEKDVVLGTLTLIGAFLFQFSYGSVYAVGMMLGLCSTILGHLNLYLKAYMNISEGECILVDSIFDACQVIGAPIGGIIAARTGYLPITMISIVFARLVIKRFCRSFVLCIRYDMCDIFHSMVYYVWS